MKIDRRKIKKDEFLKRNGSTRLGKKGVIHKVIIIIIALIITVVIIYYY